MSLLVFFCLLGVFSFLPGYCASYNSNIKIGFHVDGFEDQLANLVSQALSLLWSIAAEVYLPSFRKFLRLS